jgi:hypothetical protein
MNRRHFLSATAVGAGAGVSSIAMPAIAQSMPQIRWRLATSWPKSLDTLYGSCEESTSDYQNSPIQYIIETGQWLDTILSETTDRHFPILATLRAQGITHYVMAPSHLLESDR